MGQYYGVEDCVDELLEYLCLYKQAIQDGLIDNHYQEQAKKVLKEIGLLSSIVEGNGDLSHFDFNSLKRNVSSVFHPDRFNKRITEDKDSNELFGRTLGVIQDIGELKENGAVSFKYNSCAYEDTGQQNSYNETKQQENPRNEDPGYYTISQFFKDKFNSLFKGIPSSREDYFNIKERYDRTISSLEFRAAIALERILRLQQESHDHRVEWSKAIQDDVINQMYNNKLQQLISENHLDFENYRIASNNCAVHFEQVKPLILAKFNEWKAEAAAYRARYDMLVNEYRARRINLIPTDFEKLHNSISSMEAVIKENYFDGAKAFTSIQYDFLSADPVYQELFDTKRSCENCLIVSKKALDDFRKRECEHKKEIKRNINATYQKEQNSIDAKLSSAQNKKEKLDGRLLKTKEKKAKLMQDYGLAYEYAKR